MRHLEALRTTFCEGGLLLYSLPRQGFQPSWGFFFFEMELRAIENGQFLVSPLLVLVLPLPFVPQPLPTVAVSLLGAYLASERAVWEGGQVVHRQTRLPTLQTGDNGVRPLLGFVFLAAASCWAVDPGDHEI